MRVKILGFNCASALVLLVVQTAFAANPVTPPEPKTPATAGTQEVGQRREQLPTTGGAGLPG